jgi:NADH:ubiquinone oxidoreductase subunit H
VLLIVITTFAYSMLFERKIHGLDAAASRPNRVGPWGMMQPAADAVKMMFKEDLTPNNADPVIYRLAPFISLITRDGNVLRSSRSPARARRRCGRSATSTPASCSSSR